MLCSPSRRFSSCPACASALALTLGPAPAETQAPYKKGGVDPPKPSIGQQLKDLRIQRQRSLSHLPLKQDLIHQLPQPRQGAETAAIAEIDQGLGAERLERGAAGLVRMGHEGRSAGHRHQGGAGSRTSTAGLARSLRPARTMERPGRRLSIRGGGQTPPEAPLPMPTGSKLNRWPFQATC